MDEPYRVEVLHIVNPHMIFLESLDEKGEPVIQQVGIYGVLPVFKTIDIDGKVRAERCENWPIAANTVLREFLGEHKNDVYFVPMHVDERTTIFDDNIHQFGDIIIKRTTISLTDHLINLVVAEKDVPTFHQKLASGSLKLKLNTARTEEVLISIEKYYKRQKRYNHDWQKTIDKQTSLHQESKKIKELTEENLRLLDRSTQLEEEKEIMKIIEQKQKDLDLCKDANMESIGCGSRRNKSRPVSATTKRNGDGEQRPHDMFSDLKQFLKTHGKKKDINSEPKSVEIGNHLTPKRDDYEIQTFADLSLKKKSIDEKPRSMKMNNSVDNTDKSDSINEISKTNRLGKAQNELLQQVYYRENRHEKSHQNQNRNEQSQSQQQQCSKDEQNQSQRQQYNYYYDKNRPKQNNNNGTNKGRQIGLNMRATGSSGYRERRVVYCPDIELNSTNLKNYRAISITAYNELNDVNPVEVQGNKTKLHQNSGVEETTDDDYSVINKVAKDTLNNEVANQTDLKISAKADAIPNTRFNASILCKKLLALKSAHEIDENMAFSSNSDETRNQKDDYSPKSNTKRVENQNTLETRTHPVSQFVPENARSSSAKADRTLSNSIQQLKTQDLQKINGNSCSTSDTSVKDTSSSAAQSKTEIDQPKFAENIEKGERNVNPFKNLDGSKSVFVEKLVTPILMVHTKKNSWILPQCEIRDVPFNTDIRMMLKSMNIQKPKRLQTVSWPYILRGHSMFIVAPAEHGKTLGYLPAVCNLVVDSPPKLNGKGPICIIVCATALSVSEIESYCKRFIGDEKQIVTYFFGRDQLKITTALLNGCHVLICTAPGLLTLLESEFGVDLRRLTTFVFDDCERLSQVYATELTEIIQKVTDAVKNRADQPFKVQYVVASRLWCDFMTPLAKNAPDTVIAIGASQECVLYSKTKTSVNFVKNQTNKVKAVVEFLEEIDKAKRTVIVCGEDEEVVQLENILTAQKNVVFSCHSAMTLHDLCRLNEAWANYEEPVLGPILVCCDGNLTHLNITNANYLIHFSLPPMFSIFCKRFSVLNENYASIFGPAKDDVKIKILLDDTNVEPLPKIIHFVKRCTKQAFPMLDNVLLKIMEAKDLKKAENLTPLCNNLLMHGECPDLWNCKDRHTVFENFDEPKDWMPKQGVITFIITHFHSAVTYSAKLLANITKSGPVKYPQNHNTLSFKMGLYYSNEANRKLHGVPKVGDICAVAKEPNFFQRCRVLKVYPGDKNTCKVLINLMDEEQKILVSDVLLYYLPDDLKAIETYTVTVRLANIQPKDRDVTFSLPAKSCLEKTTKQLERRLYMRGQVVMTLGNTIFVDTAEACVDLSTLGETVVKQDFKDLLLKFHAEPNPRHMQKLKNIGGMISTIEINDPKVAPKAKKCPEWAHLGKDEFTSVILSSLIDANTIFLRHVKFCKIINSLMKDIKEYVEKAPEIDQDKIYVGNIVLAEFPDDVAYERARIDEIVNDKVVNCFFVDNGDWRQVSVNKLKLITDNILHRIPFQAIECRLIGVKPPGNADAWPEFSTHWLDDNCFEDKDGNQKRLYVKYFTKEAATVTGGQKYGVVLFDTNSEEDVVINKMMIELNLAKIIADEVKYIDEPLDIKPVKVSDSSSDVSDDDAEKHNNVMNNSTPVIKDLVPLQPKENEASKNNDIPLSVPLVNSDSDSDITDKWDVNVNDGLLGMFQQPSKANIKEYNDKENEEQPKVSITTQNNEKDTLLQKKGTDDELKINNDTNTSEKAIDTSEKDISNNINATNNTKDFEKNASNDNDTTIEPTQDSIVSSSNGSIPLKEETNEETQSLDSDDISEKRIRALDVFRRKFSREEVTAELSIDAEKGVAKKAYDTLDSDDLSSAISSIESKITPKTVTEPNDPPRKPKVVWRQTKTTLTIKIILIGVEDYTLEIKEKHMKFQTWHNDITYEFEIELYGVIIPKDCVHSNKGQYIQVRLVKMLARNWLSLIKDFSNKKWIVYDVDAIESSSEEEEKYNDDARKAIKQRLEAPDTSSDDDFADDLELRCTR